MITLKQYIKKLQEIDQKNENKRLKIAIDTTAARDKCNNVFTIVEADDFRID